MTSNKADINNLSRRYVSNLPPDTSPQVANEQRAMTNETAGRRDDDESETNEKKNSRNKIDVRITRVEDHPMRALKGVNDTTRRRDDVNRFRIPTTKKQFFYNNPRDNKK